MKLIKANFIQFACSVINLITALIVMILANSGNSNRTDQNLAIAHFIFALDWVILALTQMISQNIGSFFGVFSLNDMLLMTLKVACIMVACIDSVLLLLCIAIASQLMASISSTSTLIQLVLESVGFVCIAVGLAKTCHKFNDRNQSEKESLDRNLTLI